MNKSMIYNVKTFVNIKWLQVSEEVIAWDLLSKDSKRILIKYSHKIVTRTDTYTDITGLANKVYFYPGITFE